MLFEHIPSFIKRNLASVPLDLWTELNNLVIRVSQILQSL